MNRLQFEKSPYLLQHASNPVDWYPWGDEAFRKAEEENKPIFLSIGYSTCHWCHVMERESFENGPIAAVMNENFICIKVDREERPDIDKVYMTAVQMMTGSGGWPLSVFLTPGLKPFYGGTYFPPKDSNGRPGFPTLLQKIHEVWMAEKENILQSGDELVKSLQQRQPVDIRNAQIEELILKRTYHQIAAGYDPKFAGFGAGPKFPRPVVFNFLFRYYHRTREQEALSMALTSLMAMASGGMYDHLGGGFHRYSVDAQWRIPHFEKMVYDQAQLIHSFLDAYQITHDDYFAQVARETLEYVLREMTSPAGGFYSAEDADSIDANNPSHKTEGAFYVWEKNDIERFVTTEEASVFCYFYAVEENGNAFADPLGEFRKKNILYSPFTIEQTAEHFTKSPEEITSLLSSAKKKLLAARTDRPRPQLDDKILTSWNGLMIGACARASRVLGNADYCTAALNAADFIRRHLYDAETKSLKRRFRDGESKFEAHLDDYAFLVSGILDLYEATFDHRWIEFAVDLSGTMITLFWDSAEGGFYDTSGKDPSVLVRMKEAYDGAEPTGNSTAASALLRLYELTGDASFNTYAEKTIKYFSTMLIQSPQVMPQMMCAVDRFIAPPEHLVIVHSENSDALQPLVREVYGNFHPHLNVIGVHERSKDFFAARHPFMKGMEQIGGKAACYYCRHYSCLMPAATAGELHDQLKNFTI